METPAAPIPSSSEPEPAPAPTTIEGVVKEIFPGKLVLTLMDGTDLVLDTSGLDEVAANPEDTAKAEYTGVIGTIVSGKIDITAIAKETKTSASTPANDSTTPSATAGKSSTTAQSASDGDGSGTQETSNSSKSKDVASTNVKGDAKTIFDHATGLEVYDWTTLAISFGFVGGYVKESRFLSSDYTTLGIIDLDSLPNYAALVRSEMDVHAFVYRTAKLFNDYRCISSDGSDSSTGTSATTPSDVPSMDD